MTNVDGAWVRYALGNVQSLLNYDWCAFAHQIEQFDYIRIPHSHTTTAGGRANLVLVFGAMDVDVAVACIGILLIQAVEPQDTGHDQILGWRNGIDRLESDAASKNRATRRVAPNLLRYSKTASWRFHASHFRP